MSSFLLLLWFFYEGPSEEEEEACIMLQDCLDLFRVRAFLGFRVRV